MPQQDTAAAIIRARRIAVAYRPDFLSDPVGAVEDGLVQLGGHSLLTVFSWTDRDGVVRPGGFVSRNLATGRIVVSNRGTIGKPEWESDLDAIPVACRWATGCLIHNGVLQIYETIRVLDGLTLISYLTSIMKPGEIVDFEGHSLGGGLCTAQASHLAALLGKGAAVCRPFCGMRIWDETGAAWMDAMVPDHIRSVVIGDIVPHCPPEWLIPVGFFHGGIESEFNPHGQIKTDEGCLHHIGSIAYLMGYAGLLDANCTVPVPTT